VNVRVLWLDLLWAHFINDLHGDAFLQTVHPKYLENTDFGENVHSIVSTGDFSIFRVGAVLVVPPEFLVGNDVLHERTEFGGECSQQFNVFPVLFT